jgi:hypothetical protein
MNGEDGGANGVNGRNGDGGKGKQNAEGGMRGGYVGLMNCVFAAQKAVRPSMWISGLVDVESADIVVESPHRRVDASPAEYRHSTTDISAAGGAPD